MGEPRVLLIVATLGRRDAFLEQTLRSIREQEVDATIVVVTPPTASGTIALAQRFGADVIDDPGSLAAAINLGATALKGHEFINWLNDDDLLEPGSLRATVTALDTHLEAVVAFGACRYIDPAGQELWVSRAGKWAPRVLGWGPDLIPQPGMLVRANAWREVGGLDETYKFAFDLDLLLKLKRVGTLLEVDQIVSSFRWHPDSLTVSDRRTNIVESERAKQAALSPGMRKLRWIWEPPVRWATHIAAREVHRRAVKAQKVGTA